MNTIPFFGLLKQGCFKRHQNCTAVVPKPMNALTIAVSHRWETLAHPDPTTIQFHGVVRFVIQACMMAIEPLPTPKRKLGQFVL